MNEPIPIIRDGPRKREMTHEEFLAWQKQKSGQQIAMVLAVTACLVVLAFVVPLGVLLTRLAMGT